MRSSKYGLGLAVAACMAIGAGPASAATLNVSTSGSDGPACGPTGSPCLTIGQAVTNANDDDTIEVAAGTYTELVNVTKRLTINGAQKGVDARTRNVPAQETVVNGAGGSFNIPGSGVTLDGLTVSGNTNPAVLGAGIAMSASGSNRRLLNTIVEDNIIGLSLNNDDDATTVLRHNIFRNNDNPGPAGGSGVYGDAGINNVVIDENTFTNHPNTALNLASGGPRNDDVEITDNTFGNSVLLINVDNASVSGNSFTDDDSTGLFLDGVRNVDVRGNSIAGAGSAGLRLASAFGSGPSRNVEVVGNTIAGNNVDNVPDRGGVRVDDDAYTGVVPVHFNRIVDNTGAGVSNASNEARVDAENNWWGCNLGADTAGCDTTSGADIDVSPHLVLGAVFLPDLIQTGATSTLKADLSVNSADEDFAAPPFPNTPVAFSATGGTVANATRTLQDGGAMTTYTAGGTQNTFAGTATLDGQAANAAITVKNPANGATGQSVTGATGPQGRPGAQGSQGAQGDAGLTPSAVKTGKVGVTSRSLKASKRRKVSVSISCPRANGLCEGRLSLLRNGKVIARQAFVVRGGRSGNVTFTLSRKAYRALKKSQRVRVDSFSRDLAGAASETAKSIALTK